MSSGHSSGAREAAERAVAAIFWQKQALEFMLLADAEDGTVLSCDIAGELEWQPRQTGARMKAMCERGLVAGSFDPWLRRTRWYLTEAGRAEARR